MEGSDTDMWLILVLYLLSVSAAHILLSPSNLRFAAVFTSHTKFFSVHFIYTKPNTGRYRKIAFLLKVHVELWLYDLLYSDSVSTFLLLN